MSGTMWKLDYLCHDLRLEPEDSTVLTLLDSDKMRGAWRPLRTI